MDAKKYKAIPGGGGGGCWMNLGGKKEVATSYSSQQALNNLQKRGSAKDFGTENNASEANGTSIFDPVLCELIYRWFSQEDGIVLDPFAGGSVRGIVASKLKRNYIGIELRLEQVEANIMQAEKICSDHYPTWICGDSKDIINHVGDVKADLIFSCPPYANLEVYSDDPLDLSTMEYNQFLTAYRQIINDTCKLLNDDSFACFVVGEVRSKKNSGIYYNFVGDTVKAFMDAGMGYYNEAILITAIGSLPIRAGHAFEISRKLGKTHQNILVFLKGDAKKAANKIGKVDFGEIIDTQEEIDNV